MKHMDEGQEQQWSDDIDDTATDLEVCLLEASGINDDELLKRYLAKIDNIHSGYHEWARNNRIDELIESLDDGHDIATAQALHLYLTETDMPWYCSEYRFHKVIDNFLAKESIGDCKGLTSLYSVLAIREDLPHTIAFDDSHVISVIRTDGNHIAIDHTTGLGYLEGDIFHSFHEVESDNLPALILNQRAIEHIRHGRPDKAIAFLDEAVAYYDQHPLYHTRALAHRDNNDPQSALTDIDKAERLRPDSPSTLSLKGEVFTTMNDISSAMEAYSRSIEIEPKSSTLTQRALLHLTKEEYEKAIHDMDWAIQVDPHNPLPYANKARILFTSGEPEEALECFTLAVDRSPMDLRLRKERAMVARYEGAYQTELTDLSKILNNAADHECIQDRGEIYELRGQDHLAERDYAWLADRGDIRGNMRLVGFYARHRDPRCFIEAGKAIYRFGSGLAKGTMTYLRDKIF